MPAPITPNEEAAAVTSCSGFDFVFSTDTSPYAKDNDDGHICKFYA